MEDELERLLHDARAGEATRSRASVIALRELAAEDATLSGVLQDLADERRRVRLAVRGSLRVGAVVEVWSGKSRRRSAKKSTTPAGRGSVADRPMP